MRAKLSGTTWSLVGLMVLAVVALVVALLAMRQYRAPAVSATPRAAVASAPGSAPGSAARTPLATVAASTPRPTSATPSPAPTVEPTGLALAQSILTAPGGASVLVFGDGSGNETDEWVGVWARDHLAKGATVTYRPWDRGTSAYAAAVRYGSGEPGIQLWNAGVRRPDMALEPARIGQAWQKADLVLLSYGHRRSPSAVKGQLDAVLAAVRAKDADVPVVVMIQNPDRADTAAVQEETTRQVKAWADAGRLATVDIYGAFMDDPTPRNDMVEADGSPTARGSALWAATLATALKTT